MIPFDRSSSLRPDTDGSPYNWGTTASRVTYTTGRAVVGAAGEVVRQAKHHASHLLECAVDDIELRPGGRIGVKGAPRAETTFRNIAARAHWAAGGPIIGSHSWLFEQVTVDPKRAIAVGNAARSGVFSFGAMIVDVEVDEASGKTDVLRTGPQSMSGAPSIPSASRARSKARSCRAWALRSPRRWSGIPGGSSNPSLMDYKVPTSQDAPFEITPLIVEAQEPDGPFGAKGAGEIGMNAVPAAIANAVTAATGCRFNQLPLTPERVLRGILASGSFPMRFEDYPPQEPVLRAAGLPAHLHQRSFGVPSSGTSIWRRSATRASRSIRPLSTRGHCSYSFMAVAGQTATRKPWRSWRRPSCRQASRLRPRLPARAGPCLPGRPRRLCDRTGVAVRRRGRVRVRPGPHLHGRTLGGRTLCRVARRAQRLAIPARFAGRCDPRLPPDFRRLSVRRGRGLRNAARASSAPDDRSLDQPKSSNAYPAGAAVSDRPWREAISRICPAGRRDGAGVARRRWLRRDCWCCRAATISPPASLRRTERAVGAEALGFLRQFPAVGQN